MDNNIENNNDSDNSGNNDNNKTLLGSFDVRDLFRNNTDDTNDANENKNINKMTVLLITNDDANKKLEILKEIMCDFYCEQ